jgi:hypothetical protein
MASWSQVHSALVKELGVTERPANTNRQKYGAHFGQNGVAWCAWFVSWVFDSANAISLIFGADGYTVNMAKHFYNAKQWYSSPKAGDIVFFHFGNPTYGGRWKGIHHVGVVEGVLADGRITTIEGNTSPSTTGSQYNGGCVARRVRSQKYVAGYGRPKYDPPEMSVPTPVPNPEYHKWATITRDTQLWNQTIGTKRAPSPEKGGVVYVVGNDVMHDGNKYIEITWGGNPKGGWIRYDHMKWVS